MSQGPNDELFRALAEHARQKLAPMRKIFKEIDEKNLMLEDIKQRGYPDLPKLQAALGLSPKRFAEKFDFPISTVQKWDTRTPSRLYRKELCEIAKKLHPSQVVTYLAHDA